jgi:hypothetical protein
MSDDLTKRKPLDSSRININEPYEVNYWCAEFGVTKSQLLSAVKAVGTSVSSVRKHLGKQ